MDTEILKKLEELKIPNDIIQSIQDTKSITLSLDEEEIIRIEITKDLAYDLYCDDFLATSNYREVGMLDVIYSNVSTNIFDKTYEYAEYHKERVRRGRYDAHSVPHQTALVCYILSKANDLKYNKYETIYDVKDPVPFQVYKNLIKKSHEGIEVYTKDNEGNIIAGLLEEIKVRKSMFGMDVHALISIVSKGAKKYVRGKVDIQIHPKEFIKSMEDMGLSLITPELKKELTEMGKKYIEMTKKPTYCECHGEVYTQGRVSDIRHAVNSRVMIDVESMRLLNPMIPNSWYQGDIFTNNECIGEGVPEDMLWMCSPYVYGFSFGNKIWCRMTLKDLSDIIFSENAFDELIIPQATKDVFVASLTHDMPSLDSISDKGAGKIFLLYGAPGVGKTMTAESVSEFLRKPLYFVSVGELGVNPEQLETSLDNVMKIANSWDAIILLDEVDVFAVKREGASIERNAMTAIFLRMLERYSGIMFMTTNLLNNLDDAFISRATAVIKYNDLSKTNKAKIWQGIIEKVINLNTIKVNCSSIDLKELSEYDLNGRVIKNTIRLAYSLAASKNEALSMKHIRTALKLRQCNNIQQRQ